MPRGSGFLMAAVLGAAVMFASTTGVAARRPLYVGIWAAEPTQCGSGQDEQDAPLILGRSGYDQHETHCSFQSVQAAGVAAWRVRARCGVEGDRQGHAFTLSVLSNRLTIADSHGLRVLLRCR